jgi:hypothetical protein
MNKLKLALAGLGAGLVAFIAVVVKKSLDFFYLGIFAWIFIKALEIIKPQPGWTITVVLVSAFVTFVAVVGIIEQRGKTE